MKLTLSNRINLLFDENKYYKARTLLKRHLKKDPKDHWLLTRIATTYYEEKKYKQSLIFSEKALSLNPRCPLVLWDYSCTLDMLGREKEAISIWRKLLRRGINSIAYGECGEGKRWAKSLLNDCRYRIGLSYADLGKITVALHYFREHLLNRKSGIPSAYTIIEVRNKVVEMERPKGINQARNRARKTENK